MAKSNRKFNANVPAKQPAPKADPSRSTGPRQAPTGSGSLQDADITLGAAAKPSCAASGDAKQRKKRRKKFMGIGEALRELGFDAQTIAENYVSVAQRLKGRSDSNGSIEKLLVDILKECSKYIEPGRAAERSLGSLDRPASAPVHVHLVHNVMRPARSTRQVTSGKKADAASQSVSGSMSSAPSTSAQEERRSPEPDATDQQDTSDGLSTQSL